VAGNLGYGLQGAAVLFRLQMRFHPASPWTGAAGLSPPACGRHSAPGADDRSEG
jgi:hypothetical protein